MQKSYWAIQDQDGILINSLEDLPYIYCTEHEALCEWGKEIEEENMAVVQVKIERIS